MRGAVNLAPESTARETSHRLLGNFRLRSVQNITRLQRDAGIVVGTREIEDAFLCRVVEGLSRARYSFHHSTGTKSLGNITVGMMPSCESKFALRTQLLGTGAA